MRNVHIDRCTDIGGKLKHQPLRAWPESISVGIKHYLSDYVLRVETYDIFQVLCVRRGCLVLETPESEIEVAPGQTALLRVGSTYTASSPRGDTWCVHFAARGYDRDDYRGPVGHLDRDPTIQSLTELLYIHLTAPAALLPELIEALGRAFAARAIFLGQTTQSASLGVVKDYEASHAKAVLDSTIRSGRGTRELLAGSQYSYRQLARRFKEAYGLSPKQYQVVARWQEARNLLDDPQISITAIAYELGFSSSQYFAQQFKAHHGLSPSQYRGKT